MQHDNQTTERRRFKCISGDGATLIVDTPPTYPGDVTISLSFPSRFVIVSPDMAREIAAALMDSATVAELAGAGHAE